MTRHVTATDRTCRSKRCAACTKPALRQHLHVASKTVWSKTRRPAAGLRPQPKRPGTLSPAPPVCRQSIQYTIRLTRHVTATDSTCSSKRSAACIRPALRQHLHVASKTVWSKTRRPAAGPRLQPKWPGTLSPAPHIQLTKPLPPEATSFAKLVWACLHIELCKTVPGCRIDKPQNTDSDHGYRSRSQAGCV